MEIRCMGCMQIKHQPVCEHCGYDEKTQNNTHQLPVGTVVGEQYILGRVLGQGGFGITYLGWDQVMNAPVAVKEYFPSGYAGRDTLRTLDVISYDNQSAHSFETNKKRFLREAESLAKLWDHPQIVKVLRHFEENGTAYIAMEYVEGMDLRKYLKQLGRPMTMEEMLKILGPVIEALSSVHKAELVHRDISPDNIMVLPDGKAKLLDFGAARYVENADAEKDRNTSTQAILKHGFAPPEQYRSHGALGPWTDVYALCATIYYCLTGKVPPEAMARTIDGQQIHWEQIPGLSQKHRAVLEKGMAIQAKSRFHSAQELWEQLSSVSEPPKSEQPESVPVSINITAHGNRLKKLIALTAALLAAVGLFTFTGNIENNIPAEPKETYSQNIQAYIYEENHTGLTITGYEGTLSGNVILPGMYDGKPVTSIGSHAFEECRDLSGITIPDSVKSIGSYAFHGCTNLSTITLPNSITFIGISAFRDCTSLTSITIPPSVTLIESFAFYGCSNLKLVTYNRDCSVYSFAFPKTCAVNYY